MGVVERRQREKQERRESILEAAERVFLRNGVAGAKMDEIAHEAELSKGTLYLYFRNKDELYLGIAMRCLDELYVEFQVAVDESRDMLGLEQAGSLLRRYVAFGTRYPNRLRVAMDWVNSGYSVSGEAEGFKDYRSGIDRLMQVGTNALEAGQADGSVRKDLPASLLSVQIWGSTLGLLMLQASSGEVERRLGQPFDFRRLLAGHLHFVVRGLAADGKAPERFSVSELVAYLAENPVS
jgi:AcrR family transcriptional regulator